MRFQVKDYNGYLRFPAVALKEYSTATNKRLIIEAYSDYNIFDAFYYDYSLTTDFPNEYHLMIYFNTTGNKIEAYINVDDWKYDFDSTVYGLTKGSPYVEGIGYFKQVAEIPYYYSPITSYDAVFVGCALVTSGDSFDLLRFGAFLDYAFKAGTQTVTYDLTDFGHIEKYTFTNKAENKVNFEKVRGLAIKNRYRPVWTYDYSLITDENEFRNILKSFKGKHLLNAYLYTNDSDKMPVRLLNMPINSIKRNVFKKTSLTFECLKCFDAPISEVITYTDKKIELDNITTSSGESLELKIYNDVLTTIIKIYAEFTGNIYINDAQCFSGNIQSINAEHGIQTITIDATSDSVINKLFIIGV